MSYYRRLVLEVVLAAVMGTGGYFYESYRYQHAYERNIADVTNTEDTKGNIPVQNNGDGVLSTIAGIMRDKLENNILLSVNSDDPDSLVRKDEEGKENKQKELDAHRFVEDLVLEKKGEDVKKKYDFKNFYNGIFGSAKKDGEKSAKKIKSPHEKENGFSDWVPAFRQDLPPFSEKVIDGHNIAKEEEDKDEDEDDKDEDEDEKEEEENSLMKSSIMNVAKLIQNDQRIINNQMADLTPIMLNVFVNDKAEIKDTEKIGINNTIDRLANQDGDERLSNSANAHAGLPMNRHLPIYRAQNQKNQTLLGYRNFFVRYCNKSRLLIWTLESVTSETVEEIKHRHWQLLKVEPKVLHKNLKKQIDYWNITDHDAVFVGNANLYPYPGEPHAIEQPNCKYCTESNFWPVFHHYVKFLTEIYEVVYIWSGVIYYPLPRDLKWTYNQDYENVKPCTPPTHFFKCIYCCNGDGTNRLECYRVKNEPITTEHLELNEYNVARDLLEKIVGYHIFPSIKTATIKEKTRHPGFV